MEEWKIYKLGEITSKIGSGATPKGGRDSYLGGNISLIRSQNVLDFSFSKSGLAYINEMQAEKLNNVEVYEKDVLLNITGDSVARVCIVPNNVLPARVNQHVAIIRGNEKVDYRYLLYYLQYIKPQLLSLSQGGATRNALTKKMIEELEIKMPSKGTQKEIVSILYTLDTKIALNRRINDNLEQQAQALFKSWFVDFEPFKNGKFVESEIGMIPEGWKVGNLLDVAELSDSKRKPLSAMERSNMNKVYPYYGATSIMDYVDDYLFDGIYLLMGEDGSVMTENGFPYLQYVSGKFWVNNHAHIMQGKNAFTTEMLHCLLFRKNISEFVTGAVQAKISQNNMKRIKLAIAPANVLDSFSKLLDSIYSQIRQKKKESDVLCKKRDLLLPKLMSGKIKINDLNS